MEKNMTYQVGVDIGASKVLAALIKNGRVSSAMAGRLRVLTRLKIYFENHAKQHVLSSVLEAVDKVAGSEKIYKIGVGVPCVVSGGKIKRCFNIPVLEKIGLKKLLEKKYKSKVFLINDTKAMLCYELYKNPALAKKRVFYIAWGTGIGGAFAINGEIQEGRHGLAGEIGHSVIGLKDARRLEDYAAGRSLKIRGKTIWLLDLIKTKNSPKTKEIFKRLGRALAAAILNSTYYFDPDIVIVGGGLSILLPYVLPEIKKFLKKEGLISDLAKIPVRRSKYAENAGTLGAALF